MPEKPWQIVGKVNYISLLKGHTFSLLRVFLSLGKPGEVGSLCAVEMVWHRFPQDFSPSNKHFHTVGRARGELEAAKLGIGVCLTPCPKGRGSRCRLVQRRGTLPVSTPAAVSSVRDAGFPCEHPFGSVQWVGGMQAFPTNHLGQEAVWVLCGF